MSRSSKIKPANISVNNKQISTSPVAESRQFPIIALGARKIFNNGNGDDMIMLAMDAT